MKEVNSRIIAFRIHKDLWDSMTIKEQKEFKKDFTEKIKKAQHKFSLKKIVTKCSHIIN